MHEKRLIFWRAARASKSLARISADFNRHHETTRTASNAEPIPKSTPLSRTTSKPVQPRLLQPTPVASHCLRAPGTLEASSESVRCITTRPKWDGFRLLIDVGSGGEVRGWSRKSPHGTDLTARLGSLPAAFTDVAPGTTFDGELVAVSERDGKPAQDFAAVTRAVFTGRPATPDGLRFVAFDLLAVAGEDVRPSRWEDRDARLRETLPVCDRIRVAASQPATIAAHQAIVALGFEGTVLKRLGSAYRPGRHRTWIKRKARFTASATLCSVRQDREGGWRALCELEGRRVHALAGARTAERIGQVIELIYSRVDADGSLREARVAPAP